MTPIRRLTLLAALFAIGLAAPPPVAAEPAPAGASAKPQDKKGPALGPALFDKKKPIEITSDRLDVDQDAKTAIFEGKVDAIQGEIHLRADKLTVYYDSLDTPAGSAAPAAAPASPPPEGAAAPADPVSAGGGKIRRMDVNGKVFVSSPTETASGDKGVYEAETGKITLTGNVVLTRGGNVIRGSKLVIDVDSGRSVIDAKSSSGGGRVKGLFVPKKDQNEGASRTGTKAQADPSRSAKKTAAESAAAR